MTDRSRTFKTPAVILRRTDFGEADRLLTLLTPHYGKIRAIAKGARRPTSRSAGHVELYTVVEMVIGEGRNLNIVTQIDLIEPFLALHDDLNRIAYANLFAELIDRFSADNEENAGAYELLVAGLGWLCEPEIDLRLAARYFELRLLEVMGYAPSLFECAVSGEELEAEDQFYSAEDGGVVSASHAVGHSYMISLPLNDFKILRHFSRYQWAEVKNLKLRPENHFKLEQVLHSTIMYLLEQRLQSVAFLKRISNEF